MAHTIFQIKWSKFYLKIPARESQHCLQSNLSQIHSYHGLKRQKKKRNSNLWEVCFSQQLLWASCCLVGQGISCSFCTIAIQQHTAQHAHLMCSYRELHEMWHFIRWIRLLGKLLWREVLNEFGHFMQMQITGNGRSNRILYAYRAREPHINPDSFTY